MPDVIRSMSEDIFRTFRDGDPNKIAAMFVEQHEQILTLQQYCNELSNHMEKIIESLKMSQALYKENKAQLAKLNARFMDPYKDDVKAEQFNEPT